MAGGAKEHIPVPLNAECSSLDFCETTSVTLEWRIRGLKQVFDSTKGESKSKCIKSAVFGDADALWECIWYPNAGAPPGSNQPQPSGQSLPHNALGGAAGGGGLGPGAGGGAGHIAGLNPGQLASLNATGGLIGSRSTSGSAQPVEGEFSSFYLSAVPTQEEKDSGLKGKWSRRGLYAFRFEIKTHNKGTIMASKEAYNHVFSSKTVNWGWQSFARRDVIFNNAPATVRQADSFIVVCTVSAGATPPAAAWLNLPPPPSMKQTELGISPSAFSSGGSGWKGSGGALRGLGGGNGAMAGERQLVPRDLVSAIGMLFNDEQYSDVEFVLPARKKEWTPYQKQRTPSAAGQEDTHEEVDGFEMSGVSTATTTDAAGTSSGPPAGTAPVSSSAPATKSNTASPGNAPGETELRNEASRSARPAKRRLELDGRPYRRIYANKRILRRSEYFETILGDSFAEGVAGRSTQSDGDVQMNGDNGEDDESDPACDDSDIEEEMLSDNSSNGTSEDYSDSSDDELMITPGKRKDTANVARKVTHSGPSKTKLIIRDSAHRTWQALLYWLYTDTITFAPLSSTFIEPPGMKDKDSSRSSATISTGNDAPVMLGDEHIRARREWCEEWADERGYIGRKDQRPLPCSAKAIYRLADKFNLDPLKQRAYAHILANMTVQNIPYEAFSRFSATYEHIRKVQLSFFFEHWEEIKGSPALRHVWRTAPPARHPGFDQVWALIMSQLVYKGSDSDEKAGGAGGNKDDHS